ncbi:ABC transporter ATP-binding protein [Azospira sp. APE16]|uniref:ABC transporter ATP-binding protein n=1 Tax=Azospira sp. APE16 TaxID=3394231 RepID=UPI003A4DDD66
MAEPLLIVEGLRIAYGGIQAVKGITFHVDPGETVALIGANGAGKTSTLKALARQLDAAGGSVRYQGREISALAPHELVGQGIALVPEGRGVFARLTVTENLEMGAYCRHDKTEIADDLERIFALLPRLKERHGQLAGTLSGGEQQMLAMGRALMSRPKLLLLDEPSMGLAPIMVQKVFEVVQEVASQGMTILLVEQNARLALQVSRRGYVMESGDITLTDAAGTLLDNPRVKAAYLGE